jgi:very-short-patch-repair endonuclease
MLASESDDLHAVCAATSLALPGDAVFTHLTSARLRGWWLPNGLGAPIIANSIADDLHVHRRGVYVRRSAIPVHQVDVRADLRVASPAWTIVELAEHLALIDLVIVMDGALHGGDVTVAKIKDAMVRGRRGVRVLRRAVGLCDARSESPWETVLRLLHVLSGIPVEPQHVMRNRVGVAIGRGDLLIRGTQRVAEYDGAGHRDRHQHQDDLRREKAMSRAGYERYGYVAREILGAPERVIADAEEALGLPASAARTQLWRQEVRRSTLTPEGGRALDRRLERFVRDTAPRRRVVDS